MGKRNAWENKNIVLSLNKPRIETTKEEWLSNGYN
jgi:hypothetical protein